MAQPHYTKQYPVGMTEDQRQRVQQAAQKANMTVSQFFRASAALQISMLGIERPVVARTAEDQEREHLILNSAEGRNRPAHAAQLAYFSSKPAAACIQELADSATGESEMGASIARDYRASIGR